MKEYKVITGQLAFTYLSKFILVALNFFLFIILTRFLTKGEYGILSLFFVTIMLVSQYIHFGLPEYVLKEFAGLKDKVRRKKLSHVFSFQLVFIILFLVISLILLKPVLAYFHLSGYYFSAIFVVLIIASMPLSSLLLNFIQAQQRLKLSELFNLLKSGWILLIILFSLIFGYLNLDVIFSLRFFVLFALLVLLFVFMVKKEHLLILLPKKSILKPALAFSLPLMPLFASEYVINAGDRYLLGFFIGSAAVGSYAYFYSILNFILAFSVMPINMLFSYAARDFRRNKEKSSFFLNAGAKYAFMILVPAIIGFFVLRKEIITMITGPKYLNDLYILPFLIAFPIFEVFSTFYKRAAILQNKTKYLAVTYIIMGIVNIALNIILIPLFGIIGAAIATIVTYAGLFIILYFEGKKVVTWNNSFIRLHKIILCGVIMGLIISFLHPTEIVSKLLTIAFGVVIYFILLFVFKTFVQDEIKLMKSILESRPLSKRLSKKIFR